jgi:hypothetical protein
MIYEQLEMLILLLHTFGMQAAGLRVVVRYYLLQFSKMAMLMAYQPHNKLNTRRKWKQACL